MARHRKDPARHRTDPAATPASPQATAPGLEARELLELWIRLAKGKWASLVIVPADVEGSSAALAKSLADIGQRLSFVPVTAIAVTSLEYGSALALADLQQHLERRAPVPAVVDVTPPAAPAPAPPGPPASTEALALNPGARLVISIPPVLTEPLGLPAAQQADVVLVTIHLGRTPMGAVRRTLELIGRDRVAGCVLVRG
jgi:hypothetical protein